MNNNNTYVEELGVAVIQTSLDYQKAWVGSAKISKLEEGWAVYEIGKFISALNKERTRTRRRRFKKKAFIDTKNERKSSDIILLPELAVPNGFLPNLVAMANSMNSIIIAGMDYQVTYGHGKQFAANKAVIIVPSRWRGKQIQSGTTVKYIGKTYPAPEEEKKLNSIICEFKNSPEVWIFDGGEIGKFGVAICYDLLDLNRLAMYRKQIQHLFILAYNRDTNSFDLAAEAMSRMIFCNVVICNCGHFGGSLAVAPYKVPHKRTIYRHCGAGLASAQEITLPVQSLLNHQQTASDENYKSLPPGYKKLVSLKKRDFMLE